MADDSGTIVASGSSLNMPTGSGSERLRRATVHALNAGWQNNALSGTAGHIYTIISIIVCNQTSTAGGAGFQVNDGSNNIQLVIYDSNSVGAYQTFVFNDRFVMEEDDDSNFSHTLQAGFYTKIGNRVFCNGAVTTNANSGITGSQACRMSGLPFTGSSTSNTFAGGNFVYMAGGAFGAGEDMGIRVEVSSSVAYLFIWNSTAGTSNLPCSSWSADGNGRFAFQYMTDL